MTADQLIFVETFAAFILASLLSFCGGRVSRDKEVERLRKTVDIFEARAIGWQDQSERNAQNRDDWKDLALAATRRADAAEAQLASLPKRGARGQFEKRGA